MAEKSTFTCPICGRTFSAESEAETIKMAQEHAKNAHQKELSAEQIKSMMKQEEPQTK